jgi:hypothetical protein
MKINRNTLKELILEEMNKMEEQEIPPVIKAPPKPPAGSTPDKKEPAEPDDKLPTDVERDLKIAFATKFDELVKDNINTPAEAEAFLGRMIDLMEKIDQKMIVRVLTKELAKRSKQA